MRRLGAKAAVSTVAQLLGMSTNQFAAAQLVLFGVFTLVLAPLVCRPS